MCVCVCVFLLLLFFVCFFIVFFFFFLSKLGREITISNDFSLKMSLLVFQKLYLFSSAVARPSHGFWGTGEQGHSFQWNKGLKLIGIKAILGNREHRTSIYWFWGTVEQSDLFHGNKGTGTPLGGSHDCVYRRALPI